MCFLEREVYAFCGERVRGAMLRARVFLFMGGPQKATWTAGNRPAAEDNVGGARMTAGKAIREERHERGVCGKREEGCFLFLEEKIRRYFLYLLDGDSSRSVAIAALGYRPSRENVAQLRHRVGLRSSL